MKKLGLIGGTGPESTIEYYRQIEHGVQKLTGHFPNLVIESLSVFDVLGFCERDDYDGLTEYLLRGFECLKAAGAELACLTGITPHIVFDSLQEKAPMPLVSIIEAACEKAKEQRYTKIALLGTYPTMKGRFFQDVFQRAGIDVITPDEEEMLYIKEKIETELELGIVDPQTQKDFCNIIDRLRRDEGIQAIVLGCTELPAILNDEISSVPCLDVMNIHVEKLISMIRED
jgi:aspartate racemase